MVLSAALAIFFLLLCCISAEPSADFPGDETSYRVIPTGTDTPDVTGTVSPNNIRGTYLYGYVGCNEHFKGAKGKIDDAYYDAWLISNTAGVVSDIDWNSAAALEFLGAPGLNKVQQPQIQAVFANTATVIYSYIDFFQHYIKQNPCQPDPPNSDKPATPVVLPFAYSGNSDPDSPGTSVINFCEGFFNRRSLIDVITFGKALVSPHNLKLVNYNNRAQILLYKLFHLDLAVDSPQYNAYGTLATKILARWDCGGNRNSVGYWVQRNAHNLAYYALAKHVMSKNGNIYPHLPIVTNELARAPFPKPDPGLLATFVTDGSDFYLNTTDDLTAWDSSAGEHYPDCSDNLNESENNSSLTIDGFAPDSEYPDDYISQVSTWIEALGSSDGGSDSGSGGDAGQQIAIASYINPLGNSASWERLLAYDRLLEITDDNQPNPYDNLPSEAYMQGLVGAVPGGTPPIHDVAKATSSYVAGLPSNVAVFSSDYTSVTLTWSSVANALGYAVYKDGSGGGSSRTILVSTKSLPADGPIANVGYTQNGDTVVYKADVLVPYAFVLPGVDAQGVAHHEIVNYMVEGNDFYSGFYKYTGAWYETTTVNADWAWTSIGVAPQSQSGYTYTWNVPFSGTDAVASEYVIQGQGI
ncbi:hypothetical protein BDV34DRAFT_218516 [Aspergillus parasiticus]|uniref:Uncharacterized protein n=1 Tax=Aspergillus parasiticus TaxID=5067 RepID=A0A5N6D1X4_ASPPA|nr:hypothetical protein BDV34DRAFT_218516 [Aspergillus parasiticus]